MNNRLEELRNKYPRMALELDLVSGRVSHETGKVNPDYAPDPMQDHMEENVLEIIDLVDAQGHSGFTHNYMLKLLIPLLENKPITPLTGKEWEWDVKDFLDEQILQNNRCSQVFKVGDRTYNLFGKTFSDDGGDTWYTNQDSSVDITFPCAYEDLKTKCVIIEKETEK